MILSNQIHCHKCGDKPYSANRHDFKSCQCGVVSVDGGLDYLRRVGDFANSDDMSIVIPEHAGNAAIAAIDAARSRGCNALGILCAIAITLRDNGVDMLEN